MDDCWTEVQGAMYKGQREASGSYGYPLLTASKEMGPQSCCHKKQDSAHNLNGQAVGQEESSQTTLQF